MYQKTYGVTLIGHTDLLLHKDNVDASAKLKKWQKDPANKGISVAGDDRTPPWTWIGYLYHDAGKVCLESDNIMSMLRDGGKKCPGAKAQQTMKAQTQSGIICNEFSWPILVGGKDIPYGPIEDLFKETDFDAHCEAAKQMGFSLFVKRAKIGAAKHVRVRPRFTGWSARGTLTVTDPQITTEMLQLILTFAGKFAGIGDWRPGTKTPGQFGMFEATVEMLG